MLALLDVPVLAARFNIDERGAAICVQWVNESGVRWGMDDDNVRELDLPPGKHTRRFGLTRMLLGYTMDSSQGEPVGPLPYDESSGPRSLSWLVIWLPADAAQPLAPEAGAGASAGGMAAALSRTAK